MTSKSNPSGQMGLKMRVRAFVIALCSCVNFHQNRRGSGTKTVDEQAEASRRAYQCAVALVVAQLRSCVSPHRRTAYAKWNQIELKLVAEA